MNEYKNIIKEFKELLNNNIEVSIQDYQKILFRAVEQKITTATVADILNISTRTVHNMTKDGRLVPLNPGSSKLLFSLAKILEYRLFHK